MTTSSPRTSASSTCNPSTTTSKYRGNVASCVASYVKQAILDPERRAEITENLKRGLPDVHVGQGVTALVDISGYSALTSELSKIGKMGSEIITKTVSDYLDQVIMAISRFRGDVIKFLGDAILVCFPKGEETENETTQRAFLCCLYISTQLSQITIDLDVAIQENNRIMDELSSSADTKRRGSVISYGSNDSRTVTLLIHVAMAAGEISHCIIGDPNVRMDYCISGICLQQLGDILDATKSGELGVTKKIYAQAAGSLTYFTATDAERNQSDFLVLDKRAVSKLYEDAVQRNPDLEEMEYTADDYEEEIPEEALPMLKLFVNQALLKKFHNGQEMRRESIAPQSKFPRSSTVAVKSEFRMVSIIFVKLLSPFSPQKAQTVMSAFVSILKQWEGIFQQYSVDDKGQTMLACFGLPPWTHEKDPLNAIKAALDFEEFARRNKTVGEVTISVATGELLFSLLGRGERRDASLLGDVVNLAARLMSLPLSNAVVKCDKVTYNITKQDVAHTSLGLHKVKGKIEPVEVWTVSKKDSPAALKGVPKDVDMFGYNEEKAVLKHALLQWNAEGISQRMVIEGPSGIGKSKLLNYLYPRQASLLADILPNLGSSSSGEAESGDAQTRCFLVKHMVVRMITRSLAMEKYVIILDDSQGETVENLQNIIEKHDTFHYLVKQDQDEAGGHPYFFRHIQLMQALYNSQSFSERSATHLAAAEYYESQLAGQISPQASRDSTLPVVLYHYRKTSDVHKQVMYLEELGIQNFRRGHSIESVSYLELLIDLVFKNPDEAKVDDQRRAHWLAILASQNASSGVYTIEQYDSAVLALRLNGYWWPAEQSEVGKAEKVEKLVKIQKDKEDLENFVHFKGLYFLDDGRLREAVNAFDAALRRRGDESGRIMGSTIKAQFRIMQGDITSDDDALLKLSNEKDTFQVLLAITLAHRKFLTMDFTEAEARHQRSLQIFKNSLPNEIVDHVLSTNYAWRFVQQGHIDKALDSFESACRGLSTLRQPFTTTETSMVFLGMLSWMFAKPCIPNQRTAIELPEKSKARIVSAVDEILKTTTFFALKNKMGLYRAMHVILLSSKLFLLKQKKKSLTLLLSELKKSSTTLDEMTFPKGFIYSILSIHLDNKADKQHYYQQALRIYQDCGLSFLEWWLEWNYMNRSGNKNSSQRDLNRLKAGVGAARTADTMSLQVGSSRDNYQQSSSCVALYVKEAVRRPERRAEIREKLKRGVPDVQTCFGVTAIFDLCGYSELTSQLFLGDAILVCFSSKEHELKEATMDRALECSLYVSARLNSITINLETAIEENNRILEETTLTKTTHTTLTAFGDTETLELRIHMAATTGIVTHVLIGDPDHRMDYCIDGPCIKALGEILDATKSGELGLSAQLYSRISKAASLDSILCCEVNGNHIIAEQSVREIFEVLEKQIASGLEMQKGRIHINRDDIHEEEDDMLKKFINAAFYHKLQYERELFRRNPNVQRKATLNPTAVAIRSEFRAVSILFVKLLSEFSPKAAQAAMQSFVAILEKFEGVYHQYSVDDKGQTMLACFGLPPWTHEKDPLNAAKAALEFEEFATKNNEKIGAVSISVTTGDLLFTALGSLTGLRQDASLLGDVVNLGARLMCLPVTGATIKCDKATYLATQEDLQHTSLGQFKVKGKAEPVEVWHVFGKNRSTENRGVIYGYVQEKEAIKNALEKWDRAGEAQRLVIEGRSGVGKTKLLDFLCNEASKRNVKYCGSEITHYTPYVSLQPLISYLFKLYGAIATFDDRSILDDVNVRQSLNSLTRYSRRASVASLSLDQSRRQSRHHQPIFTHTEGGSGSNRQSTQFRTHLKDQIKQLGDYESILTTGPKDSVATVIRQSTLAEDFLKFMGEDTTMASLLADVLPILKAENTGTDMTADGQTRCVLVKNLVVRLVQKGLTLEKFMIVFDDCQWLDAISSEIIQAIIKSCPNLMIVLFARPIKDSQSPALQRITQFPEVDIIVLQGLGLRDVESILLSKFQEYHNVKQISETVCRVLLEKSERLPLYIDTISEALKSRFHEIFQVNTFGTLDFKGRDGARILSSFETLSSSAMAQFDKLNPWLQSVLRMSSCLGQYHTLEDLSFFLDTEHTVSEIATLIKEQDIYHFLNLQDHTSDSEDHFVHWRHVQLMNAVYSSISFSERSSTHLRCAQYYEKALDVATDRDFILPIVVHHYRKTSTDVARPHLLTYLEELGIRNFRKAHILEAASYLEALIELVDQNKQVIKMDPAQIAHWLSILAIIKVTAMDYTKEQYNRAAMALNLVGAFWPQNDKDVLRALVKAAIILRKLWKDTKGGTRPLEGRMDCFGRQRKAAVTYYKVPSSERMAETITLAYRAIFRLGVYTNYVKPPVKLLVMLCQCHIGIVFGYRDKAKWAGILYLCSFGLSWTFVSLSRTFWKQAEKVEGLIDNEEEKEALLGYYQFKGFNLFQAAKLDEAADALNATIQYCEKRGDTATMSVCMSFISLIGIQKGSITSLEADKIPSDTFQVVHIIFLTTHNMLTLKIPEATSYHLRAVEIMRTAPPNELIEPVISANESWMAFQEGKYKQSLDAFERACEGLSTLRQSFQPSYSAMILMGFLAWMLVQPCAPPLETNNNNNNEKDHMKQGQNLDMHRPKVWTETQKKQLLQSLERVMTTTTFFAVKKKMRLLVWSHAMFQSAKLFLLNNRKKAMRHLLSHLGTERSFAILEELKMSQANVYSILALYLENDADRAHYLREAMIMYREFGFTYLEKWLLWNDKCLH
ncbi:hypothetical protein HDV05_006150 [Chytridiales sp. JEL 0842]|nr:hypothetical protein HDV05_006150 [Chytridiales sp. JEL 0842]